MKDLWPLLGVLIVGLLASIFWFCFPGQNWVGLGFAVGYFVILAPLAFALFNS